MKRLNYYQVHKNKKPSFSQIQSALIAMKLFSQQAIIVSQSFKSFAEKALELYKQKKL